MQNETGGGDEEENCEKFHHFKKMLVVLCKVSFNNHKSVYPAGMYQFLGWLQQYPSMAHTTAHLLIL